jgi:hypothetical protein
MNMLLKKTSDFGWMLIIPLVIAGSVLLIKSTPFRWSETVLALAPVPLWATLPPLWAYPADHVLADQFYVMNFFILMIASTILMFAFCCISICFGFVRGLVRRAAA